MQIKGTENKPIDLTYVGRRLGTKNKLYEGWQASDSTEPRFYDKFRPGRCSIGTTFTVDETPDGKIVVASARDPRKTNDTEVIAAWEVKDRDAWNEYQKIQLIKRLGKETAFATALAPIKRIYRKTPGPAKQTFLLMLMDELDRP